MRERSYSPNGLSSVGADRGVFGCDNEVLTDAGASPGNPDTQEIYRKKVAGSFRLTPIKPAMISCPGQRVHNYQRVNGRGRGRGRTDPRSPGCRASRP